MSRLLNRYTGLSNPLKTQRAVELALVVLVALFVLQLMLGAWSWISPSQPAPVSPAQDSLVVMAGAGPALASVEQREAIEARPLFWKERRPLQDEAPEGPGQDMALEEQAAGKIEGIKLAGIFGAADSVGIIVVAKGKKHRLAVGDEVIGWELVSAEPTQAVFSSGQERATLSLKRKSIVVADPAPAPEGPVVPAAQSKDKEKTAKKTAKKSGGTAGNQHPSTTTQSTTSKPESGDSLSLGGPIR